jgi:hypothetical protein
MNGSIDRDEIKTFLQEQFDVVEETGGVSIVSLMHHAHTGPVELLSTKAGHSKWGNAESMAQLFDAYAIRHAKGVVGGGAQQYELTICRGGENRASSVLPFIRVGALNVTGPSGSIATEPPTELGLRQQAQRWGEQIVALTHQSLAGLMHSQQSAIDARDRRLNEVENNNRELFLGLKQTLLEIDRMRHDTRMQELSAMRAAEFQKQLMALAPALINMMVGKDVLPTMLAEESLFDAISAGASPDQMRVLTSFVTANVQNGAYLAGVINDRYSKYHEKQERVRLEEQRLMKALPGRSYDEGERDAAGDALRLLRGDSPPAPVAPKLPAMSTANGNGMPSVPPASKDTELIERLFAKVPEGMIGTLAATLAGEDPELAQAIQTRYAEAKK